MQWTLIIPTFSLLTVSKKYEKAILYFETAMYYAVLNAQLTFQYEFFRTEKAKIMCKTHITLSHQKHKEKGKFMLNRKDFSFNFSIKWLRKITFNMYDNYTFFLNFEMM